MKHIKVKVWPGSAVESVERLSEDSFEVFVREAPRLSQANRSLVRLMRRYFGEGVDVRIVRGQRAARKILSIS